jgi:hypothetical protein
MDSEEPEDFQLDDLEEYLSRYAEKEDDYTPFDADLLQAELIAEQRENMHAAKPLALSSYKAEDLHMKLFELMVRYNNLRQRVLPEQLVSYRSLIIKMTDELERKSMYESSFPFNRDLVIKFVT